MTNTPTHKIKETLKQIKALERLGCEIVRVAVLDKRDGKVLSEIKKAIKIPLVADIHFEPALALLALDEGVDKIRINPGNFGGVGIKLKERCREILPIVKKAKDKGITIRLGINSGSLEKDILQKYGSPSPEAMVESAIRYIEFFESVGFFDTVISLKSTDVEIAIRNYKLIAQKCDYPLHLGITEAGLGEYGKIKSAIGIGALLLDGIGDTIRVSLTGDPLKEIPIAYNILKATGRRLISPEIISCPGCGRKQIDLEGVAKKVERYLKANNFTKPLRIAIMGCVVNGIGESVRSDIGVAGGKGEGLIFRGGKIVRKVKEDKIPEALFEEINKI